MNPGEQTPRADFGIIVALKVERDAVLRNLKRYGDVAQVTREDGIPTYYVGRVWTSDNTKTYKVVVTMLRHMGNLDAAIATSDLLYHWRPRQLLVVGIAGGADKDKQKFGDILVSESIFYYEEGKIKSSGPELRPRMLAANPLLFDRALNFKPPIDLFRGALPAVHFGPIASGEKVIADKETIKYLTHYQPKLIGVEMETAGAVAAAFSSSEGTRFLAIKGISDFADVAKDDKYRALAADNAADWTFSYLESCPVPPESSDKQVTEEKTAEEKEAGAKEKSKEEDEDELLVEREKLFDEIDKRLDNEDFRTFCFLIGVPIDEILRAKKPASIRELILYFEASGKLERLKRLWHVEKIRFD